MEKRTLVFPIIVLFEYKNQDILCSRHVYLFLLNMNVLVLCWDLSSGLSNCTILPQNFVVNVNPPSASLDGLLDGIELEDLI